MAGYPRASNSPGPAIKRENDDQRQTPFRTRAYHANEDEEEQGSYDNSSYESYERGFYEQQNVAYWTQQVNVEQLRTHDLDHTATKEEPDVQDDLEHTDAHITSIKDARCRICREIFPSNNKLHLHLKMGPCFIKKAITKTTATVMSASITPASIPEPYDETKMDSSASSARIVKSTADDIKGNGYGFRGWHYATVETRLHKPSEHLHAICLDTGCTMSLIDRIFLTNEIPDASIRKMASPISVRGLGTTNHQTNEYVVLKIYIPG